MTLEDAVDDGLPVADWDAVAVLELDKDSAADPVIVPEEDTVEL